MLHIPRKNRVKMINLPRKNRVKMRHIPMKKSEGRTSRGSRLKVQPDSTLFNPKSSIMDPKRQLATKSFLKSLNIDTLFSLNVC